MTGWRISKYDPSRRDGRGRYLAAEWTSVHDIGKSFAAGVLSREEYARVEAAYLQTIADFYRHAGSPSLRVGDVEIGERDKLAFDDVSTLTLSEDAKVEGDQLELLAQSCLRELCWCRLESEDASFALHFGYDYYVYIDSHTVGADVIEAARKRGIYVEPSELPYSREAVTGTPEDE